MNTINYFIAETDLPEQNSEQSYGPISSTAYRVTSLFSGSEDLMAYAVTDGEVFIVEQDDQENRVNLILKPSSLPFGIPVRYFIYRGLLKSDFLDQNNSYNGIRPMSTDDSDFIKKLRKGQHGESALFLYEDLAGSYLIDDIFSSDEYQFGLVKQGDSIGRFDSELDFGFEILLEETFYYPNLEIARTFANIIEISAEGAEVSKLQILNYIDPAAYYGLYVHNAYSVGTNNLSAPKSQTKEGIYNFIKRFNTRSTVYIDIRDVHEYPMDWFEDSPQNIKLTINGAPAINAEETPYRSDGFPLKILTGTFSNFSINDTGQTYYVLKLSVPVSGNSAPLLILHAGYWLKSVSEITENMIFSICNTDDSDWSDDKAFVIFNKEEEGINAPIASYLRLQLANYQNIGPIEDQVSIDVEENDENTGVVFDGESDVKVFFPFHMNDIQ
ncbi:hypothetical protein LX99_04245 [Mucilaginibacter oryzae]|uniref:Uncharacterized protein n=1 Tax=Mucilaginibacter oryzae TaxID=468058 RepID=A0A316HI77_9SPHI|nr:hypothetical protein [Mucilaginibacter oryzae]PWK72915.1 hypothetical protein LX99_04245 [Mucilaginibacter oryzae]